MAKPFTTFDPLNTKRLGSKLVGVVDRVRDIHSRLALRQDRVFLVRTRWSGGQRGDGTEEIKFLVEILPTPKVTTADQLQRVQRSVGAQETGDLFVSEITGTLTADQLSPTVDDDESFYWETRSPTSGERWIRRRYVLMSPPGYSGDTFEWRVNLVRCTDDQDALVDP